ncbi:MAG: FdhF/YdeP family oxidoreductase [Trueperaceae bacterium]
MGIFKSRPKRYVRPPREGWDPATWASWLPLTHLENFGEVFRAGWENRDQAGYAWRILNDGVCDGCALGTNGMKDWTVDGVHLCNVRLRLLRLNTLAAMDGSRLRDVSELRTLRSRDLRELGRLPYPMVRRRGEPGFRRISWNEALETIAERMRATHPDRTFLYLTSRGIPNETYYVAQKAMRAIGTHNVDNAARVCHSPSTVALKAALGVGATTCSYSDLIGTDLITFIGSNVAKNQPVMMKYLYHAKKAGTRVVTVNPYEEPGMDAYWVPSDVESALFGTKITDRFFRVASGGDRAFLYGTLKELIERSAVDRTFVDERTTGFEELRQALEAMPWDALEAAAGLPRSEMRAYAEMVGEARRAVFVWGMGVTQHTSGEDNVRAIIDLALSRGFVGREGCGLMPIRGHSGVQGGAEMGAYATALPGGHPVTPQATGVLAEAYGFDLPESPGLTTPQMLDAAAEDDIDVLLAVGGNFREVMPDPSGVDAAFARIGLRVHIDIVPSSQMLVEPADTVLLLPTTTRYEMAGGVTETSTERRIIFSPEIPGPRVEEARPEWEILGELAARVRPDRAEAVRFADTQAIRDEIARVVPMYSGIEHLRKKGDQVQYGGAHLCAGPEFPTGDGKARFHLPTVPAQQRPDGSLAVITRRGKQFNSIVQAERDSLNGSRRDAVLMAKEDAERLGLRSGDAVVVENERGSLHGHLVTAPMAPGAVQVHWPEANVLLDAGKRSAQAHIPAYKDSRAQVRRRADDETTASPDPAAPRV